MPDARASVHWGSVRLRCDQRLRPLPPTLAPAATATVGSAVRRILLADRDRGRRAGARPRRRLPRVYGPHQAARSVSLL